MQRRRGRKKCRSYVWKHFPTLSVRDVSKKPFQNREQQEDFICEGPSPEWCWWKAGFSVCVGWLPSHTWLSQVGCISGVPRAQLKQGTAAIKNRMAFSGTLHGWQQCCSLWLCISAGCATSPTKPELMWDVCTSFGQKHWEAQLSQHGWHWAENNASSNTEVCTTQPYEHICTSVSRALPVFQDVNCQNAELIPGGSMQSELIEPGQTHQ